MMTSICGGINMCHYRDNFLCKNISNFLEFSVDTLKYRYLKGKTQFVNLLKNIKKFK